MRDLVTDLAADGKRVKVCVQQALGQGVFQVCQTLPCQCSSSPSKDRREEQKTKIWYRRSTVLPQFIGESFPLRLTKDHWLGRALRVPLASAAHWRLSQCLINGHLCLCQHHHLHIPLCLLFTCVLHNREHVAYAKLCPRDWQ